MKLDLPETPINQIWVDSKNKYYIKRDDLLPFSFGGNKVRKAINFFNEMDFNKNNCVVTYGSSSSNHCRVIANMAAAKGLPCVIISNEEGWHNTYNTKMINLFDAEIIIAKTSSISETISNTLDRLSNKYKPYFINGGGHGDNGTQAYVDAYDEIRVYQQRHDIDFDYIFHASGTGTTQAGLVCGQIINSDFDKKIIGISIARSLPHGKDIVINSVTDYLQASGKDINKNIIEELSNFIDDYICGGYGKYNKHILSVIKENLTYSGIPLDPTYTGKAFWGMKQFLQKHEIKNKNILFVHTGGTPLFFDNMKHIEDC